MATRQKKNSRFTGFMVPGVCICILSYFGFHAYQGNLGIRSRALMEQQSLHLQFELARLQQERQHLEHKVGLLRDGQVEKDMLDQQARENLNLIRENELVIFYK